MSNAQARFVNPFGITKAVDLNDDQIQSLWVNVSGAAAEFAEFARPASPMPTFILGAKGSGKTHLMRYHAFELQRLRYRQAGRDLRTGIAKDGYIGIYMRCTGLNSGRFAGKRQPDERWAALFAYYIELWLTQHLLEVMRELRIGSDDGDEAELCEEILALFDKPPEGDLKTLEGIANAIAAIQRQLDYEVNNCVMTGKLNVEFLATRGRLIFGIPRILSARYGFLRNVLFVYSLDELENLTANQQKFINTLVREKELPSTLRIGSRLYGVKTYATDSADEENLRDSEYERLPLDALFRQHKGRYTAFAKELIEKRLEAAYGLSPSEPPQKSANSIRGPIFEEQNEEWSSPDLLALVGGAPSPERRHFVVAREKLTAYGLDEKRVRSIVEMLAFDQYPLVEKVSLLLLYQDMNRGHDPLKVAPVIRELGKKFLQGAGKKGRFESTLEHYKSDLLAQLYKENDTKQSYLGLETFIMMSAGLPRALLTILRSVYDWSHFRGEDPLRSGRISKDAQIKGVKDASDWFYENMRKAGDDGAAIQIAIDRIARLFRINRFADKPTECSLITFSFPEEGVSQEAMRILRLAESRSFLNRIPGGQRDKNSERVMMKFQLNNMLSPRWDLPLGRRGTHTFDPHEIDLIFDPARKDEFEAFLEDWREKRTAPFFGKRRLQNQDEQLQQALF